MNSHFYPVEQKTPPKVEAAMQFLRFAQGIEMPAGGMFGEKSTDTGRTLSKTEAEVYDSALRTLLEYFNIDGFGEPLTAPKDSPELDDPRDPERAQK